ncbi:hypothetical protein GGX14DRAFT_563183 [Mycena pura]|uniref:Uncharacterized protein n=1 Tax=Mycena pura TaxID=153505 RepID=A0AAD6YE04_9AGAR|nr:hypothetical protein GGX14DRAFT_563183 [Mycena pura]
MSSPPSAPWSPCSLPATHLFPPVTGCLFPAARCRRWLPTARRRYWLPPARRRCWLSGGVPAARRHWLPAPATCHLLRAPCHRRSLSPVWPLTCCYPLDTSRRSHAVRLPLAWHSMQRELWAPRLLHPRPNAQLPTSTALARA